MISAGDRQDNLIAGMVDAKEWMVCCLQAMVSPGNLESSFTKSGLRPGVPSKGQVSETFA